ncbi:hypothetical protein J3F84DRAFT_179851 [Trichoderma pleuroticola]
MGGVGRTRWMRRHTHTHTHRERERDKRETRERWSERNSPRCCRTAESKSPHLSRQHGEPSARPIGFYRPLGQRQYGPLAREIIAGVLELQGCSLGPLCVRHAASLIRASRPSFRLRDAMMPDYRSQLAHGHGLRTRIFPNLSSLSPPPSPTEFPRPCGNKSPRASASRAPALYLCCRLSPLPFSFRPDKGIRAPCNFCIQ